LLTKRAASNETSAIFAPTLCMTDLKSGAGKARGAFWLK